ncbi:MAG: hypothetical protein P8L85_12500 [Rubripirellula sp.]|nr:hypothetical protein [Rubripirellula sp.]
MSEDPFARFERSRSGWLLPVALFVLGAIPTALAVSTVHQMGLMRGLVDEADGPDLDIDEGKPALEDSNNE